MTLDCIPISDLTPATGVCKIKVRLVHLWGFPKKDKPEEYSSIDLLLLDEKGDKIQASIKPIFLTRFKDDLQEDSCYDIMNFELGPNLGQFRGCSHPYKINFIFYTCVKPCENLPNSELRYNFCPFDEIIRRRNDDSVFVDIIGEIVGMNELKDVRTGDGQTKLLTLQLRDLGDSTLDIARWGKIGESVYCDVKSQKQGLVIFIGSLMKKLNYKEVLNHWKSIPQVMLLSIRNYRPKETQKRHWLLFQYNLHYRFKCLRIPFPFLIRKQYPNSVE